MGFPIRSVGSGFKVNIHIVEEIFFFSFFVGLIINYVTVGGGTQSIVYTRQGTSRFLVFLKSSLVTDKLVVPKKNH